MAKNIFDDFYCTSCGKKGIPIVRKAGAGRESGHLKKLYCIFCKRETNHVECQPFSHYNYEDFLCEFENGNFTEDGARKMTYGQLRAELNKEEMQQRKEERKKKEVSTNVISVDGLLSLDKTNLDKRDTISDRDIKLDWEEIKKELDKCVLVCSNCHREIHAGLLEPEKESDD